MTPLLEAQGLCKWFQPGQPVVDQLSLQMHAGQITCLLGPSGCGKTTTLRLIAGFETPDAGEIRRGGEVISSPDRVLPPEKRRMGMVFQEYALFPHLTAEQNLAFGLSRWSRKERCARIDELCALLDIETLRGRYPHQLSGGQQQRLALGRALAPRPELLLLDEPFANLDVALRHDLRQQVFGLLRCARIPVLLVTHDQEEALSVSDQLAVMRHGRIEQTGHPDAVYGSPASRFVASFVGQASWLVGQRREDKIVTELGELPQALIGVEHCVCEEVSVLLRPEDVTVSRNGGGVPARVVTQAYHGTRKLHTLQLPSGAQVRASFRLSTGIKPGDVVPVALSPTQVNVYASPQEPTNDSACCQAASQARQDSSVEDMDWYDRRPASARLHTP